MRARSEKSKRKRKLDRSALCCACLNETMIVQKFGGTSVKSIARIKNVASLIARAAEHDPVVVVVSAMGDTTDYLVKLAHQASDAPNRREFDALLATGEQISIALVAMALRSK